MMMNDELVDCLSNAARGQPINMVVKEHALDRRGNRLTAKAVFQR